MPLINRPNPEAFHSDATASSPRLAWDSNEAPTPTEVAPAPLRKASDYTETYNGNLSFYDQIITSAAFSTDTTIKKVRAIQLTYLFLDIARFTTNIST